MNLLLVLVFVLVLDLFILPLGSWAMGRSEKSTRLREPERRAPSRLASEQDINTPKRRPAPQQESLS
jgi:hypothetical protein